MKSVLTWLQQALLPHKCVVCRREGVVLCEDHQVFLAPIIPPLTQFKSLSRFYAATDYHQPSSRALVRFLKFNHHRYTAEVMAKVLLNQIPSHVWTQGIIVPLPLHWSRRWQRGFNQSELLARALVLARPELRISNQLKRTRWTRQQARLGRNQRLKNMTGAFNWEGSVSPPERVLLLDDVCTTGSTLQAAAKALKQAGVKQVVGVTFAYQSLGH